MGQKQVKYGQEIQRMYVDYSPIHKGDIVRYRKGYYMIMKRTGYAYIIIIKLSDNTHLSCPKDEPWVDHQKEISLNDEQVIVTVTEAISPIIRCSEKLEDWISYRGWFKKSIEEIKKNHQLKKEKKRREQGKRNKYRAKSEPIA